MTDPIPAYEKEPALSPCVKCHGPLGYDKAMIDRFKALRRKRDLPEREPKVCVVCLWRALGGEFDDE